MNFLLPKKILCYFKNDKILKRSLDGFRKFSSKYKKWMPWPKLKRGLVEFSTFKENSWALEKFWSSMIFDDCSNLSLASDVILTLSFTKRKLISWFKTAVFENAMKNFAHCGILSGRCQARQYMCCARVSGFWVLSAMSTR